MTEPFDAQAFARKWRDSRLKERSGSQEHFTDLCRMLGHATPAQADPLGEFFTFEKGASKQGGGDGWADVWYKGHFAWEYKGRHANLADAYDQLLLYREDLQSPPLLVVCDMDRFEVHCNFTGSVKRVYLFDLEALAEGAPARVHPQPENFVPPSALGVLRAAFLDPDSLRPSEGQDFITQVVADYIGKVADSLRLRSVDPRRVARFLMKCLFCFFAEDVGLLPGQVFKKILDRTRDDEPSFVRYAQELFAAMATGGHVLLERIPHFDGGLFSDSEVIPLRRDEIDLLLEAANKPWSNVEPAIFGTLFERCLDPDKHEQIGRHYTYAKDIADIVEPVLVAPLQAEWDSIAAKVEEIERENGVGKNGTGENGTGENGDCTSASSAEGLYPVSPENGYSPRRNTAGYSPHFLARSTAGAAVSGGKIEKLLRGFHDRLASVKVLDPACGSGNFLYVSLRRLMDLEKRLVNFAYRRGIALEFRVRPTQLHGMEISHFAHELASVVVWIGYLQWMRDNGAPRPKEPILQPIETIHQMDAIVAHGMTTAEMGTDGMGTGGMGTVPRRRLAGDCTHSDTGETGTVPGGRPPGTVPISPVPISPVPVSPVPVEPDWPEADFIVGNPPFLGGKKLRKELGDESVEAMFQVYDGRVPREADLCCYWFEKARDYIERESKKGHHVRAGLLATQAIRGGANREVLKRIQETGGIFMAWSDRPWVLDGAAVRVSMIGFDDGTDKTRTLDGKSAAVINPDLSSQADTTTAKVLPENAGVSFMGDTKGGPFDIEGERAREMLRQANPHGRANSDVVRPWANGLDITRRPRDIWIIDFGCDMTQADAALYEAPFEYVKAKVKPIRDNNKRAAYRENWWIHVEARSGMRAALEPLPRFLAVTRVAKYRLFKWLTAPTLPDCSLIVFARSDDYFFGVLQSRFHELWADVQGTQLREKESGRRYTPTTCFETFPFPWPLEGAGKAGTGKTGTVPPVPCAGGTVPGFPPGKEAAHAAISAAAARLNELRENWLNPPQGTLGPGERKKLTLTNLYNKRPTWLADAHTALDAAVADAYGWPADLAPSDVLTRLLELNRSRAAE